jgi:cell division protein FtsX
MTESELLMFSAIQNLANNISLSFNMMNNRMKQLETNIEEKIWTKIQRALKTQEEISKVRDEIKQDIHVINAKIKDVQKSYNNLSKEKNSKATTNVRNNIVIRNSRYDERADNNEVTTNIVQLNFAVISAFPKSSLLLEDFPFLIRVS